MAFFTSPSCLDRNIGLPRVLPFAFLYSNRRRSADRLPQLVVQDEDSADFLVELEAFLGDHFCFRPLFNDFLEVVLCGFAVTPGSGDLLRGGGLAVVCVSSGLLHLIHKSIDLRSGRTAQLQRGVVGRVVHRAWVYASLSVLVRAEFTLLQEPL